jgi:superfamily II DNA or RNA helicase
MGEMDWTEEHLLSGGKASDLMDGETESYQEFLRRKLPRAATCGINGESLSIPDKLFDFQQHCVEFAGRKGRAGIYLDTGLGKTAIELAFADNAVRHTNQPALILAPLAVTGQTRREAEKFGIEARIIREQADAKPGINICNYDRLDKLDPYYFGIVVLDEASILKSYTGKTTRKLMEMFAPYRFRMAASATPAPNDHMELGQQSQFLGVMDSNEMLMRWFIADQTEMGRYRLKSHGERDFWDWMASWSRMAENPEDMGFDGSRFHLPPLKVCYHQAENTNVYVPFELFAQSASATAIHDIKRQTVTARAELAASLCVATEAAIVWCDTNYEADALKKVIPDAVEVRGSQSIDEKEELLEGFALGRYRVLLSKPSICGFGLNFQNCHKMIFAGRNFSYESYYQAVRRCWRFGQEHPVDCHIIVAEGEFQVDQIINRKSEDHRRMKMSMSEAMRRAIRGDSDIQQYNPTHEGRLPSWLSA